MFLEELVSLAGDVLPFVVDGEAMARLMKGDQSLSGRAREVVGKLGALGMNRLIACGLEDQQRGLHRREEPSDLGNEFDQFMSSGEGVFVVIPEELVGFGINEIGGRGFGQGGEEVFGQSREREEGVGYFEGGSIEGDRRDLGVRGAKVRSKQRTHGEAANKDDVATVLKLAQSPLYMGGPVGPATTVHVLDRGAVAWKKRRQHRPALLVQKIAESPHLRWCAGKTVEQQNTRRASLQQKR